MIKKLFQFLKKVIFSIFLLYSYNIIAEPIGVIIPINIFTVLLISILGIPVLFSLIFIYIFIF